ncbi:hypothetical protein MPTK1_4g21660 [Marchantia polymorpha subsp. ruderalis]|uniref:Uncharacterized protein n=2 Tax=Marchantia polymorpha TaxID=3197 RepID=A0AAF6BCD0_MARPO|nr:hypothetical protein MARPO_0090s0055 [Marchantia polymorpha]BBN09664.1 hypothetical protein Mp_4g21660 [Marchantia polymorpha subsp. ruderalis]|eukprot:PTQ33321.1 hypothetical protein MARPO_0090s0055 [Marchantia polymorpha]
MEVAVAAVTIIGQLETIYMIIDKIVQYQQMVCRYKDTCRDFVNFVKEIETVLRNKASNLKLDQERKFSNDVKRQLDNLEEHLRCAAALLSDLESPLRIAAYTGVAANKISELRGQLMEAVTLLTFHIVCSPSEKQPEHLQCPPDDTHPLSQVHHIPRIFKQEIHHHVEPRVEARTSYQKPSHQEVHVSYHHIAPHDSPHAHDRPKGRVRGSRECHCPHCETHHSAGIAESASPRLHGTEHAPGHSQQHCVHSPPQRSKSLSKLPSAAPPLYAKRHSHIVAHPHILDFHHALEFHHAENGAKISSAPHADSHPPSRGSTSRSRSSSKMGSPSHSDSHHSRSPTHHHQFELLNSRGSFNASSSPSAAAAAECRNSSSPAHHRHHHHSDRQLSRSSSKMDSPFHPDSHHHQPDAALHPRSSSRKTSPSHPDAHTDSRRISKLASFSHAENQPHQHDSHPRGISSKVAENIHSSIDPLLTEKILHRPLCPHHNLAEECAQKSSSHLKSAPIPAAAIDHLHHSSASSHQHQHHQRKALPHQHQRQHQHQHQHQQFSPSPSQSTSVGRSESQAFLFAIGPYG